MKVALPNVRKIFKFDPGYIGYDADLSGADAQVVAWEAEDEDLKAAFRAGLDVHDKNAEDMFGSAYTKLAGDTKNGPKSKKRKQNKVAVHATNYGARSRTLAITLGWTVHEADTFQKKWFSLHPGIKKNFHGKVEAALRTNRTVRNAFGYHRIFFDRIDASFTEALAWIPQSTVALTTYRGALKLERDARFRRPEFKDTGEDEFTRLQFDGINPSYVEMILQVHDSLVFQIPQRFPHKPEDILDALAVPVPYSDPLIIPWGLARSAKSWGDCEVVKVAA